MEDFKRGFGAIIDPAEIEEFKRLRESRKLQKTETIVATLPSSVDHRNRFPVAFDQGSYGTCVAATLAAKRDFYTCISSGAPFSQVSRVSPMFIYNSPSANTNDDGMNLRHAIDNLYFYGACPATHWPYPTTYSKSFLVSPTSTQNTLASMYKTAAEIYENGDKVITDKYKRVASLNDFKTALNNNHVIAVEFIVPAVFKGSEVRSTGILPQITPQNIGLPNSAHAVLVVGYDDSMNGGSYIIRNSWGTNWGDNGYFYVNYRNFAIMQSIDLFQGALLVNYNATVDDVRGYHFVDGTKNKRVPPQNVTLRVTLNASNKPSLTFTGKDMPSFDVYRDGVRVARTITGTNWTDTTTADGTTYKYFVEASNSNGTTTSHKLTNNLAYVNGDGLETIKTDGAVIPPSITETFEGSTLTIPFTGDWVRTTTSPQAGSYCYRSATISHNQSSKTSFKVTAPSGGTLEFYYRTDSEQSYDKLTVKAGSTTLVNGASGTNGTWTKITHTLPTGTTEIEFTYNKDGSTSAGTDAAYIDQVAVTGTNVSVSAGSSGNAPGTATISVASKTTSSVTLNLSASGATSFNVYRSTSATGTYTQIATSVTSPYTNTGLSSGTTYYYKTEGKNSYGTGSMSSYVVATTNSAGSPPSTASISVASKTTSSVTLNLSASGATSFNVYRSTSATGTYTQIATSVMSPYTNTGLSSGTTYYYKTEGKNSYGTGGMSSYLAATTDPVGGNPPGAVTLTVTGTTDTSVSLSYSASGASNYDIYRDGVRISTSRILTTYTDTGRTPGTTYSYYVVAKNNDGTSTSPTRTATTTGGDSGTTETLVVDTVLGLSNTGYSQSVTSSKAIASGSTFSVYVGGDVLTSEKAVKLTLRSKSGSILGTYTYTGTSNTQLKQVASNVRLPSGFVGETEIRVDHDAGNASYSNYDIAPGDASAHVSTTKRGKHRSVIVFNLKLQ